MPPNPYRIGPVQLPASPLALSDAVTVSIGQEPDRAPFDPSTGAERIELDDGSVVIDFSRGRKPSPAPGNNDFYRDLSDEIDSSELNRIATDLVTGIESDIQSLREYHDDLAEGIKMLGFKLETPRSDATSAGSPTEGMSRVYHPLLAESILRFQANARGELLPAEGPVKVEDTGTDQGEGGDDLAQQLEDALNRFFTTTASEYYPDTIRMLFDVGFGGSGFKKCYSCPIRRRPVSESIAAKHFVVSNAARDLRTCGRKTHIIEMDSSTLKRMQILAVYRDIELSEPLGSTTNPVDLATNTAMGVNPNAAQPKDRPRILYETYAEIDIAGFEDKDNGEPTGLRLPYRVTIDKDSKQILELRRNWDEDDDMKLEKRVFVKYPYVNAMSFYGIGLFHMLGNITRALTAGYRELLDSGMFANFPGGVVDKRASRQLTNEFRVAPGGMAQIEVPSGMSVRDVFTGLPYKDVSPSFMALLEQMGNEGQRMGGTAEIAIGEGKQDAPVGTTLALLEQATKVNDSVHKGLHAAQAEEFQIMKELFLDDPEALFRHSPNETDTWDKDKVIAALHRCDIVPRADPNTPSHMHRVMKVQALVQMGQMAPQLFGSRGLSEVAKLAIRTLGFEDPSQYLQPDDASGGQNDPKAQAALLGAQADLQDAQVKAGQLQLKAETFAAQMRNDAQERQEDLAVASAKLKSEQLIHGTRLQADAASQQRDQAQERLMHDADLRADMTKTILGHVSDHHQQAKEHAMQGTLASMPRPPNGAQP